MRRRGRHFSDDNRRQFFDAIKAMRDACIVVSRTAPIGKLDYRTAGALLAHLDDAVEALTGDREALWLRPLSNVLGQPVHEVRVRPVASEDEA